MSSDIIENQVVSQEIEHPYRDILVTYQGGGYDGCFWEWNFFIFDDEGNFIDIGSSGYKGISELEDALELMSNPDNFESEYSWRCPEAYITNLNYPDSIKEFTTETNEGNVLNVIERVNKHYDDDKMTFQCPYCEEMCNSGQNTGYKGAGGIAIALTGLICDDCYCDHTCGYCGEFEENLENLYIGTEGGHCIWCYPDPDIGYGVVVFDTLENFEGNVEDGQGRTETYLESAMRQARKMIEEGNHFAEVLNLETGEQLFTVTKLEPEGND